MIDFNIIRKQPELSEIKAYLHHLINSGFGLSDTIIENMKEEFPSLRDNPYEWDLNKLPAQNIKYVLKRERILPDEIFFFKKDHEKDDFISDDYKSIPKIFTRLVNVSFDKGGLIVMEYFESQIYKLFNSKGEELSDYCHDLNLGSDGLVLLRYSENDGGIWRLMQYDGNKLKDKIPGVFLHPGEFPDIQGRDIIPEMFPSGKFPIPENYPPANLTKDKVIKELGKNKYYYRYLSDYYYDNEKLAIHAVKANIFAFTLLSERLRSNKAFVVKLITLREKNQCLYSYLDNNLKKDIEIIKLCVAQNPGIIENIKPVSDKEILLMAIKKDYMVLEYCATNLLNDIDFMLSAVKISGSAIKYASKELKSNKLLALEAVKNDGFALEYLSNECKKDKDIVIEAVKNKKQAINMASDNLKNNKEFIEYIERQKFKYNNNNDLPF